MQSNFDGHKVVLKMGKKAKQGASFHKSNRTKSKSGKNDNE